MSSSSRRSWNFCFLQLCLSIYKTTGRGCRRLFSCVWLCMSCLLDRDLGNMSYTVYLDMIWGQSGGFKQRGRCRLTERLHYLKWLFVFNFTFKLISFGSGHREVITDRLQPAGPERVWVCVDRWVSVCFMYHSVETMCVYIWKHPACMESAEMYCVTV